MEKPPLAIKFLDRRFDGRKVLSFAKLSQTFFGIGRATTREFCARFGISERASPLLLGSKRLAAIESSMAGRLTLGRTLRKFYLSSMQRKKKLGTVAGLRLSQRLPSRGQRTHSNARTARRPTLVS